MSWSAGNNRRQRASHDVAHRIVEALTDPTRAQYPSESDALAALGVGRGTYREALRFLERLGVIDVRSGPGGGPSRRNPRPEDVASVLALWLDVDGAPLRSVLEARDLIEPAIARLAAERATPDCIGELQHALDELESGIGDFTSFAMAYWSFWTTLAAATGNPLLALLGPALRAIVNSGDMVPDEPFRARIVEHLRNVLAAVEQHQPLEAERATSAADAEFHRRIADGYPRQIESTVAWRRVDQRS